MIEVKNAQTIAFNFTWCFTYVWTNAFQGLLAGYTDLW